MKMAMKNEDQKVFKVVGVSVFTMCTTVKILSLYIMLMKETFLTERLKLRHDK